MSNRRKPSGSPAGNKGAARSPSDHKSNTKQLESLHTSPDNPHAQRQPHTTEGGGDSSDSSTKATPPPLLGPDVIERNSALLARASQHKPIELKADAIAAFLASNAAFRESISTSSL